MLCTRGCEKIKSQPLHKKSFAFIYLFKFSFKNTIISKCSSLRLALLGLRTSFPNEKRRSTAALDGRRVFNFLNTFFKFLQTERAAKMSLFGGSLKYDSTIFATMVFRRFWLSKREPKKSSYGSSTNTSSPLLSWLLDCLSTTLISLISSWLSFSTTATSSLLNHPNLLGLSIHTNNVFSYQHRSFHAL